MLNLFIRQPFTESGPAEMALIQSVFDMIHHHACRRGDVHFLTDEKAQSGESFGRRFEEITGVDFTAPAFRKYRLSLLDRADAFIHIRTGLSESGAFEIAYNIFKGKNAPMLFCIWKNAPLKTTLLKDLQDLCDVTYVEFEHAAELDQPLQAFLGKIRKAD